MRLTYEVLITVFDVCLHVCLHADTYVCVYASSLSCPPAVPVNAWYPGK